MKIMPFLALGALLALSLSCKQAEAPQEETAAAESGVSQSVPATASKTQLPPRKLIRTADIKFKVKDVAQSTYAIENAVTSHGGLVVSNNLQSTVSQKNRTKISRDSIRETTHFAVENNLTLRIPNAKLDTVIKSITREIQYLDYRVLKADDVALKMLSNQLAQQRNDAHHTRLASGIDQKGRKLDQITGAEDHLLGKDEQSDNAAIENLSLQDQVNYSTVTLALYQNEVLRSEMLAIDQSAGGYGNFGLELWDNAKEGWFILERLIAFVVQLWSVILLGVLAFWIYRRYVMRKTIAS